MQWPTERRSHPLRPPSIEHKLLLENCVVDDAHQNHNEGTYRFSISLAVIYEM